MKIKLIYATDPWHSYESRVLAGICPHDESLELFAKILDTVPVTGKERDKAIEQFQTIGQTGCLSAHHGIEFTSEGVMTGEVLATFS